MQVVKTPFDARFPLEAFERVARAIRLEPTPENLKGVRDRLVSYLYVHFAGPVIKGPSRAERMDRLRRFSEAAKEITTLLSLGGIAGISIRVDLSGPVFNTADDQFLATVERLQQAADAGLRKLEAMPARLGRPPKTELREFVPELVSIYEEMTEREAKKPHWLPDSRKYGGKFYRFAVAVWQCLRSYAPEVNDRLPTTEVALAQALQDHWPKDTTTG